MKDTDWVSIAYCRDCGVYGTATIRDDHNFVWPEIVHETDCQLARHGDIKEMHSWSPSARPAAAAPSGLLA
ncbi:hypothetical protein E3T26_09480 [Cryobacterium sp. TMT1-21]|uniref:Uncharacterized protein n=1 Tax=Cryobacterium shii TaxID=1259235 RepID=A0AAQ2C6D9_9MICO|nr:MULTISPECIES: hypothetical protein [Cryobacterium]TFC47096.1 hypothetical protein E3O49_08905 [Cryobacterium shii]TFC88201.1 hypothetical protein E3T24_03445 [Cryobacterium sp. TmT2-59]TFD13825.1 hypothetical protein E3T26_09480 [Cryobacterium sp. TMT1-21]TFD16978.1 hypothetical protein E3T32_14520 [Cryobacterium sp. TMT2-23]TFD37950.1 hypothetical protein E3T37_10835 [Cryobacterium sp. TMT2-10]